MRIAHRFVMAIIVIRNPVDYSYEVNRKLSHHMAAPSPQKHIIRNSFKTTNHCCNPAFLAAKFNKGYIY